MKTSGKNPKIKGKKIAENKKQIDQFWSFVEKRKPQDTYYFADLERRDSLLSNDIQYDLILIIKRRQKNN